jgi:hypothetical protein
MLSGVFRTIHLKAKTRQVRPRIVFPRATRRPDNRSTNAERKVEATYELPLHPKGDSTMKPSNSIGTLGRFKAKGLLITASALATFTFVQTVSAESPVLNRAGVYEQTIARPVGEHPAVLDATAGTWAQTAVPTMGSGAGQWTLPEALSGVDGATAAEGLTLADGLADANAVEVRFVTPRANGDHPAVIVAREFDKQKYDAHLGYYQSRLYLHPAGLALSSKPPQPISDDVQAASLKPEYVNR